MALLFSFIATQMLHQFTEKNRTFLNYSNNLILTVIRIRHNISTLLCIWTCIHSGLIGALCMCIVWMILMALKRKTKSYKSMIQNKKCYFKVTEWIAVFVAMWISHLRLFCLFSNFFTLHSLPLSIAIYLLSYLFWVKPKRNHVTLEKRDGFLL